MVQGPTDERTIPGTSPENSAPGEYWRGLRARLALLRENRALLILFVLFLFFLALSLIANSTGLLRADVGVTQRVQRLEGDPLVSAARLFTHLGSAVPLALLSLPPFIWLLRGGRRWGAGLLVLAVVFGHPLNYLIKALINRPRPTSEAVSVFMPSIGTSFPSGHAMTAVMVFGFLAVMASIHLSHRHARHLWVTLFILMALAISLSRVYLGAHFLSDIVGGWTAGLFFVLLWTEAYKLFAKAELAPPK